MSAELDRAPSSVRSEERLELFSWSPEAIYQFTWLFGDRGIPASNVTRTVRLPGEGLQAPTVALAWDPGDFS